MSKRNIYSSSLQNGWVDYPWATVNLICTNLVLAGYSDSISVSCTSYTALYLHQDPSDSTPYTNLTFWLNGGSSGGQVLSVTGTLNEVSQSLYVLPALAANTWQQFTVSLADIGVADAPDFDGIWILNNNNFTIPTFYVDDIVLTAGAQNFPTLRLTAGPRRTDGQLDSPSPARSDRILLSNHRPT